VNVWLTVLVRTGINDDALAFEDPAIPKTVLSVEGTRVRRARVGVFSVDLSFKVKSEGWDRTVPGDTGLNTGDVGVLLVSAPLRVGARSTLRKKERQKTKQVGKE